MAQTKQLRFSALVGAAFVTLALAGIFYYAFQSAVSSDKNYKSALIKTDLSIISAELSQLNYLSQGIENLINPPNTNSVAQEYSASYSILADLKTSYYYLESNDVFDVSLASYLGKLKSSFESLIAAFSKLTSCIKFYINSSSTNNANCTNEAFSGLLSSTEEFLESASLAAKDTREKLSLPSWLSASNFSQNAAARLISKMQIIAADSGSQSINILTWSINPPPLNTSAGEDILGPTSSLTVTIVVGVSNLQMSNKLTVEAKLKRIGGLGEEVSSLEIDVANNSSKAVAIPLKVAGDGTYELEVSVLDPSLGKNISASAKLKIGTA